MKSLVLAPLLLAFAFAFAKESPPVTQKTDFLRVFESETAARLQTANTTYVKGDTAVTLIGAVHIADKKFYEALNTEFKKYDRVLYEMIGGENLPKLQAERGRQKNEHILAKTYAMVANFLELTDQKSQVDYTPKNFVHGDLTMVEFQALQEKRGESLLGFAFKAGMQAESQPQVSLTKIMQGLLTGNANMVKLELIGTLSEGDDQIGALSGESVIITDRNKKCLEVLEAQIKAGHKKCGIFYGAAHFPDMEKSLLKVGFKKSAQVWMTAWDVPKM